MLRKIAFKKRVCIEDGEYIYKILCRYEEIRKLALVNRIIKNRYLLLSNIFERNIFGNEYKQLDSIFFLGLNNFELTKKFYITLSSNQKLAYRLGKIVKGHEFIKINFLNLIIRNSFIYFLRILKSFLDILFLIMLLFFYLLTKRSNKSQNIHNFSELYTVVYSKKIANERNIITYFYPDFEERISKSAFITDYDGYRFIFRGILDSSKIKNVLTILDIIYPKDILRSFLNLIDIYILESFNKSIFKYGSIFSLINSLQNINRRYFSLLIYNASKRLIKNNTPLNIFLWGEGLSCDKAFAISINHFLQKNNLHSIKLFSYIATPISINYYPHYLPSNFDLDYGIWSKNILVFDADSLKEMKLFLKNKNINKNIKIDIIRKGMNRFRVIDIDRFNIEVDRNITFFTHGSKKDLFLMLVSFYTNIYLNPIYQKYLDLVYFRLHPLLNSKDLDLQIINLQKLFNFKFPEYISIPIQKEKMQFSLFNTQYCFFGESTYINYAIKNNKKVFHTRTSFLFRSPIHSHLINESNIENL